MKHEVVGTLDSTKQFYGGTGSIVLAMADEARRIGADAVVNLRTGQKIGFFAWARPYGTGTAVKLEKRDDLDCLKLGGEYR